MTKTKEPYSIDFVNKGKPFSIPNWTTERHESALAKLTEATKDLPPDKQDKEFKFYVIYEVLSQIDETGDCTIDKIREMHAMDTIELFNAIYNAGRKGIYSQNFRKELETLIKEKEKSTGSKNSKNSENQ